MATQWAGTSEPGLAPPQGDGWRSLTSMRLVTPLTPMRLPAARAATDQRDDAVLDRDGNLTGLQGLIRLQRPADALSDLVVAHFATSVGCCRCGVSTNLGPRSAGAKTALPCRGPTVQRAPLDYSLRPHSWLATGSRITLPLALGAG